MSENTLIVSDTGWRGRVAVMRGNVVDSIVENAPLFVGTIATSDALPGDVWDGERFQMSSDRIVASLEKAVQVHLDAFAASRGYGDERTAPIVSACSYAASTHPRYGADGRTCLAVREATWDKCFEIMASVLAGSRPAPAIAELIAELPALEWPT